MKRALLLCLAASLPAAATPPQVSLVIGRDPGMVARYGWGKLKQALQAKGVLTEEVAAEERAKGMLARYALNFDELPAMARKAAKSAGLKVPRLNPFQSIVVRSVETPSAAQIDPRLERCQVFQGR